MRLKSSGWNAIGDNTTPNINSDVTSNNSEISDCSQIALIPPASSPAIVGSIPAGSTVRVASTNQRLTNNGSCQSKQIIWDSGDMLVDQNYANIHACLIGLGFETLVQPNSTNIIPPILDDMEIEFDPVLYTFGAGPDTVGGTCFTSKIYVTQSGTDYFIKASP